MPLGVLCGGGRMGGDLAEGFFVEPTILVDVDNSAPDRPRPRSSGPCSA